MVRFAMLALVISCGGGESPDPPAACTPEAQEVEGESLVFEVIDLGFSGGGQCPTTHLIASAAQLDAEFGGNPPIELSDVDFATDRVVLGTSNPTVQFIVESSGDLFVGEESLCEGVAPSCVAYVLRGDTSDTLAVIACPYTGPDPCLAP